MKVNSVRLWIVMLSVLATTYTFGAIRGDGELTVSTHANFLTFLGAAIGAHYFVKMLKKG